MEDWLIRVDLATLVLLYVLLHNRLIGKNPTALFVGVSYRRTTLVMLQPVEKPSPYSLEWIAVTDHITLSSCSTFLIAS